MKPIIFNEAEAARRLEREQELKRARETASMQTYISLAEYRRRALRRAAEEEERARRQRDFDNATGGRIP